MSSRVQKQPKDGHSSIRLAPNLWAAIDAVRSKRPGNVSRNTWITEAITEKLAAEQQNVAVERDGPDV